MTARCAQASGTRTDILPVAVAPKLAVVLSGACC